MAVSSAFVQLIPSIKGFHRDAAAEINARRMTGDVSLIPELNKSTVDKEVAEGTKGATGTIKMTPDMDRRDVAREAEGATRGVSATVKMTPDLDAGAAQRQASAAATRMSRKVVMPVELDDTFAQKSWLALQKRMVSRRIKIDVDVGWAQALAGLTMIQMAVGRVTRSLLRMTVVSTVAFGALALLSTAAAGIGGIVSALGAASAALMIIPGIAAIGAAAIGTLILGFQGVGDTMSAIASGDAEKFRQALQNLAPPARGLFVAIWELRGQFSALQKTVQGALFANLAEPFRAMATNVLPALNTGLGAVAGALNHVIRQVMLFYSRASVAADLGALFGAGATAIRNLGTALTPILQILQDVGVVGAQVFATMTQGAYAAASGWAAFIRNARETGQLEAWIRGAFTVLGDMMGTLFNLGAIIVTVFSAASQAGSGFFAVARQITGELLAMLRSAEGQTMLTNFFRTLRDTVNAAMPGLRAVGGVLVTLVQRIGPALPAVGAAFSALMGALAPIVNAFITLVSWILPPLANLLGFLAPVIGVLAAGILAMAGAIWLIVTAMRIWYAIKAAIVILTWAFNAALAANPITLVVIAIVGLIAVLIYAYHNFTWFRTIVDAVWNALVTGALWVWGVMVAAWNGIMAATSWLGGVFTAVFTWITGAVVAVGNWFLWLWQAVIVPAWNGITAAISWAWNTIIWPVLQAIGIALAVLAAVVFTVLVTPWVIAWNVLTAAVTWAWNAILAPTFNWIASGISWLVNTVVRPILALMGAAWNATLAGIQWAWNAILRPAWNAVAAAASWLWNAVLSGIFIIIGAAWRGLVTGISFVWNSILRPVWNAVAAAATWLWTTVLMPVFRAIGAAWNFMVLGIRTVWTGILQPAWNALVAMLQWMWNTIIRPIFTAIGNAWRSTMDGIRNVYHTVVVTTFNALKGAINSVGQAFQSAVDWIGRVWNRIRGILAKPVNFVIDHVYMGGVKKTWDMIAGWLKIPGLPPMGRIPENRRGGIIGGGYKPDQDTALSWVGAGESVMRPEWTRAVGPGYVNAANAAARQGGVNGVRDFVGGVNDGPITRSRRKPKMRGGFPAFAGGGHTWPRLWDIVKKQFGDISLTSNYRPGDPGYHGRGQAIDVGYGNYSRHGPVAAWIGQNFPHSTELISAQWRNGLGIKNGKPLHYGGKTTSEHVDHVHWAMSGDPGAGGGGGGIFDIVGMVIDWFINTAMKPVADMAGKITGDFGANGFTEGLAKIPGQAIDRGVDWLKGLGDRLWDIAMNALGSLFGGGGGGSGVEQWRGVALQALRMTGQPLGMVDVLLRRMNQESGGNPRAINLWDSNAKKGTPSMGLLQTIQPTFDAHKMPGFNNIWSPLDNILASIRYTISRYGSLPAGYNRAGGYDSGGWLPPGLSMTYNGTSRPEAILTAEQWDAMSTLATQRGDTTIYVDAPTQASPERIAAAVDRRLAMSGRI